MSQVSTSTFHSGPALSSLITTKTENSDNQPANLPTCPQLLHAMILSSTRIVRESNRNSSFYCLSDFTMKSVPSYMSTINSKKSVRTIQYFSVQQIRWEIIVKSLSVKGENLWARNTGIPFFGQNVLFSTIFSTKFKIEKYFTFWHKFCQPPVLFHIYVGGFMKNFRTLGLIIKKSATFSLKNNIDNKIRLTW